MTCELIGFWTDCATKVHFLSLTFFENIHRSTARFGRHLRHEYGFEITKRRRGCGLSFKHAGQGVDDFSSRFWHAEDEDVEYADIGVLERPRGVSGHVYC